MNKQKFTRLIKGESVVLILFSIFFFLPAPAAQAHTVESAVYNSTSAYNAADNLNINGVSNYSTGVISPAKTFFDYQMHQIAETGDIFGTTRQEFAGVNQPPNVALHNLNAFGSFPISIAGLSLFAQADDADGQVSSVEFYVDGESIGTGTSVGKGIYQAIWNPAVTGFYRIRVSATDDLGAVSFSRYYSLQVIVRSKSRR